MNVDFRSKDCIVMITTSDYEHRAKIAMSYILKHTDFDIVLYTTGYASTIRNPRIEIRNFNFVSDGYLFHFMNCKPYVALDMIENSDYDRMLFFDSDVIFNPSIANVFNDVKGYLEDFPLYPPCPIPNATLFNVPNSTNVEERLWCYYEFNGKKYTPDMAGIPKMWYRQGHVFMFNKACRDFYLDTIGQIKAAVSHPDQGVFMQMKDDKGVDIFRWRWPMNSEECYVNAILWKMSCERRNMWVGSSYFPCHIQEIMSETHFEWFQSVTEDHDHTYVKLHPLWRHWIRYPIRDDKDIDHRWGAVPLDEDLKRMESCCFHFSRGKISKDFMLDLHDKLGGHNESIFNC